MSICCIFKSGHFYRTLLAHSEGVLASFNQVVSARCVLNQANVPGGYADSQERVARCRYLSLLNPFADLLVKVFPMDNGARRSTHRDRKSQFNEKCCGNAGRRLKGRETLPVRRLRTVVRGAKISEGPAKWGRRQLLARPAFSLQTHYGVKKVRSCSRFHWRT